MCLKKVRRTSILHVKVVWRKKIHLLPTCHCTIPDMAFMSSAWALGCLIVEAPVGRLAYCGIIASYLQPRHVGCTHLKLQSKEGIHSRSSASCTWAGYQARGLSLVAQVPGLVHPFSWWHTSAATRARLLTCSWALHNSWSWRPEHTGTLKSFKISRDGQ